MFNPFTGAARAAIEPWIKPVLIALAGALLLTLAYCQGKSHGKSEVEQKHLEAEIKILEEIGKANEHASATRAEDAIKIADQEKELQDAIESGADPSTIRARRGCIVLRQQGRDTSSIAICRGFEADGGTSVPSGSP